ncbi:hypothetical protein ACH5RR_007729 [Cinchona calisaya]|uniref:Ribonuclease H1 N-terminal domain-containing protein n=1 Tax=Cinchona calisaya TaxID=153742 RepID=A0ABD3AD47_9GENT
MYRAILPIYLWLYFSTAGSSTTSSSTSDIEAPRLSSLVAAGCSAATTAGSFTPSPCTEYSDIELSPSSLPPKPLIYPRIINMVKANYLKSRCGMDYGGLTFVKLGVKKFSGGASGSALASRCQAFYLGYRGASVLFVGSSEPIFADMKKFYVVYVGRNPGIYYKWSKCKAETDKVPNAVHCFFHSLTESSASFEKFREEEQWLNGKPVPFCESCGKELLLKVSNARETIGKHYCLGVEKFSGGASSSSSSSESQTVISALASRCQALKEEVENVSRQRDAFENRATILEEALHSLHLEDD